MAIACAAAATSSKTSDRMSTTINNNRHDAFTNPGQLASLIERVEID